MNGNTKTMVRTEAQNLDIGLALRKLRVANGYSQQFVADCFEISRNAYIEWESNRVNLSMNNCSRICSFYGIKLSDFVLNFLETGMHHAPGDLRANNAA
ncbi:XRE family transcriptional regulator [Mucilaginibacter terrigena]|uniref:XRE family transcriptional regulator n=1 Tax=Mucilaginibacter terrigena TaxID=2492395 RepID=A0A4Q5LPT2_9SPHI|nr:helix-turn-helix transcriptional regulator [Mucilaginibacter terrigena]RYU91402.1 XRE family transcriptional regulator [Mucilaginibacter terrigena]